MLALRPRSEAGFRRASSTRPGDRRGRRGADASPAVRRSRSRAPRDAPHRHGGRAEHRAPTASWVKGPRAVRRRRPGRRWRKAAGQYDDAGRVCPAGRASSSRSRSRTNFELFHRFTADHVLGDPRRTRRVTLPRSSHPAPRGFSVWARGDEMSPAAGRATTSDRCSTTRRRRPTVERLGDRPARGSAPCSRSRPSPTRTRRSRRELHATGCQGLLTLARGARGWVACMWVNTFLVRDLTACSAAWAFRACEGGDYAHFYPTGRRCRSEGRRHERDVRPRVRRRPDRDPYPV